MIGSSGIYWGGPYLRESLFEWIARLPFACRFRPPALFAPLADIPSTDRLFSRISPHLQ